MQRDLDRISRSVGFWASKYEKEGMEKDDVLSEALFLLLRRMGRFDERKASWDSFVIITAKYAFLEFLDRWKQYRERFVLVDDWEELIRVEFDGTFEDWQRKVDDRIDVQNALSRLKSKEMIEKVFYEGKSLTEIAEELNISPPGVLWRLRKELKELEKELKVGEEP